MSCTYSTASRFRASGRPETVSHVHLGRGEDQIAEVPQRGLALRGEDAAEDGLQSASIRCFVGASVHWSAQPPTSQVSNRRAAAPRRGTCRRPTSPCPGRRSARRSSAPAPRRGAAGRSRVGRRSPASPTAPPWPQRRAASRSASSSRGGAIHAWAGSSSTAPSRSETKASISTTGEETRSWTATVPSTRHMDGKRIPGAGAAASHCAASRSCLSSRVQAARLARSSTTCATDRSTSAPTSTDPEVRPDFAASKQRRRIASVPPAARRCPPGARGADRGRRGPAPGSGRRSARRA